MNSTRKIVMIFSCLLLAIATMAPVRAIENSGEISISDLYPEVKALSDVYDGAGISSEQLLELMAKTPKNGGTEKTRALDKVEEYFLNNPTKVFVPSEYDLDNLKMTRDGDMYDGNPPYTDQEQIDRLNYIQSVYKRDYNQPKYNPGLYTTYLYTSHYVENVTFDRTQSNEKIFGYPVLAHIISENDIDAFNAFYNVNQGSAVVDNFTTLVNGMQNIIDSNITSFAAKELINLTLDSVDGEMKNYVSELKNLGIIDSSSVTMASKDLFEKYVDVITNKPEILDNPVAVIDNVYEGLGGGLSRKVVDHYVSGLTFLTTVATATSLVSPILGGVIYFTGSLARWIPTLSLAKLYYTGQLRRADRFAISVGLFDRP